MSWAKGSRYLRSLVSLNDSPQRIALGFAVGIFLAFSPLLGLHTFLGLLIAFLFGLNRVAVLVCVFVNNPWTHWFQYTALPCISVVCWSGFRPAVLGPNLDLSALTQSRFWTELVKDWEFLKPLLVGSTILSISCELISYPLALFLVGKARSSE